MKRESVVVLLGVLVALAPFSGVPFSWLTWILLGLGVIVMGLGISLRRDRMEREQGIPSIAQPEANIIS